MAKTHLKAPAYLRDYPEMRCFSCGKKIGREASRAIIFDSRGGNWGSTIWDCEPGTIRIFVHDACAQRHWRRIAHFVVHKPTERERIVFSLDSRKALRVGRKSRAK